MKKWIALILTFTLLISTTGCFGGGNPSTGTPTDPTGGNPPGDPTSDNAVMYSITLPMITDTVKADNGTMIFSYLHQGITLQIPDQTIAEKIALNYLNHVDSLAQNANQIKALAQNAYKGQADWIPYKYQVSYAPMRVDGGIISLFGTTAQLAGTPHPESAAISVTYDMVTGEVLPLNGALADGATGEQLAQLVIESLNAIKAEKYLYDDFDVTVRNRIKGDLSEVYEWYFSNKGLCIYFRQYEIAPYSAGVVIAEIPYEKLLGIIEDAYFPAERDAATGTMSAKVMESADLEKHTQFSQITLGEGSMVLLNTDATVYDIRLEAGSFPFENAPFVADCTIFGMYQMKPSDGVVLSATPNTNLRLTYTSNGQTVSKILKIDANGSVTLN